MLNIADRGIDDLKYSEIATVLLDLQERCSVQRVLHILADMVGNEADTLGLSRLGNDPVIARRIAVGFFAAFRLRNLASEIQRFAESIPPFGEGPDDEPAAFLLRRLAEREASLAGKK